MSGKSLIKLILVLGSVCFFFSPRICSGKIIEYQPTAGDEAMGYLFYAKPLFELVLPSYCPREREVVKEKVSFFASLNEYEPVTFSIYALKELNNVKISTSDLRSGENIIPVENIDVRIVKCWDQRDPVTDQIRLIPELLVKDDRIKLKGFLSSMPLTPFVATDIPAKSSKQIWITVKTSLQTKPGVYSGSIYVKPDNATASIVKLELEVLPIKLLPPNKNYCIYYMGSGFGLPWWQEKQDNPEAWIDQCRKELADMREHGFQSASTNAVLTGSTETGKLVLDLSNIKKALQLHREAGLTGPTPYEYAYSRIDGRGTLDIRGYPVSAEGRKLFYYTLEKIVEQVVKLNKEQVNDAPQLFFYGRDEANRTRRGPELNDPELAPDYEIKVAKEMFEAIHRGGGLTTAAAYRDIDYGGFDLLEPLNDLPNYSYGSAGIADPEEIRAEARRKKGVWIYSQCWRENPQENRLMAGFILWKSGATGFMPWVYMGNGSDFYNETDKGLSKGGYMNTVYPSKEGPIPTLAWEAIREGVDDVRYLNTLAQLIAKEQDSGKAQKAQKVMDEVIKGVSLNLSDALFSLTEEDLQNCREKIARTIIELTGK